MHSPIKLFSRRLKSLKDPTGRLARWALNLLEYIFQFQYRRGALNVVQDFLSRFDQDLDGPNAVITMDQIKITWYLKRLLDVQKNLRAFPMWKIENGLLYHHCTNKCPDFILLELNS